MQFPSPSLVRYSNISINGSYIFEHFMEMSSLGLSRSLLLFNILFFDLDISRPPLWSIRVPGTDPEVPGSIPGAANFLRSSGSGMGSTQPGEDN
jgi:hypothetical protein